MRAHWLAGPIQESLLRPGCFFAPCLGRRSTMEVWPLLMFRNQTVFETLELLCQGGRGHIKVLAEKTVEGLMIRHDHGSQYMAYDCQDVLVFLGTMRDRAGRKKWERAEKSIEPLSWLQSILFPKSALLRFRRELQDEYVPNRNRPMYPAICPDMPSVGHEGHPSAYGDLPRASRRYGASRCRDRLPKSVQTCAEHLSRHSLPHPLDPGDQGPYLKGGTPLPEGPL